MESAELLVCMLLLLSLFGLNSCAPKGIQLGFSFSNGSATDTTTSTNKIPIFNSASSLVPGPPSSVTTNNVDSRSITISWTKPSYPKSPVKIYSLKWTRQDGQEGSHSTDGRETSYTVLHLVPYTNYVFSLSACIESDNKLLCGESVSKSAQTCTEAPGIPGLNTGKTEVTKTTIQIQWEAPTILNGPIDGYLVHISPKVNGTGVSTSQMTTSTVLKFDNLNAWTEYVVSVQAFNYHCLRNREQLLGPNATTTTRTAVDIPYSPRNLTVSNIQAKQVTLVWEPPEVPKGPIDGYYWSYDSDQPKKLDDGGNRSVEVTGLKPYTHYTFKVWAFNLDTEKREILSYHSAKTAMTLIWAPGKPENLKKSSLTSTSITVQWDKPKDENGPLDGYIVELRLQYGEVLLSRETHKRLFWADNLIPWTKYIVYVRAFNLKTHFSITKLEGENSILEVTTTIGVPSVPRKLAVESVGATQVTLTWEPPKEPNGPVDGYQLTFTPKGGSGSQQIKIYKGHSVNATGLTPYTAYNFSLAAFNLKTEFTREYKLSEETSQSARTHTSNPSAPRLYVAKELITKNSFTAVWQKPLVLNGPLDGYIVYVTPSDGAGGNPVVGYTNDTRWKVEGLKPWTKCTVSVQAYNFDSLDKEKKLTSKIDSAVMKSLVAAPGPPVLVEGKTKITSVSIELEWGEPTVKNGPLDGYILRFVQSGGDDENAVERDTKDTRWKEEGLKPWAKYNITVQGYNIDDVNNEKVIGLTASATLKTLASKPGPPKLKEETASSSKHTIRVEWDEPSVKNGPVDGYIVRVNQYPQSTLDAVARYTRDNWWQEEGLIPWTRYTISVQAYNINVTDITTNLTSESDSITVRTLVDAPGAPELNKSRTEVYSRSIRLVWDAPLVKNGPVDGYMILVTPANANASAEPRGSTTTETWWREGNLSPFTVYKISVRAYNIDSLDNQTILSGPEGTTTLKTLEEGTGLIRGLTARNVSSRASSVWWEPPVSETEAHPWYSVRLFRSNLYNNTCDSTIERVDTYEVHGTEKALNSLIPYSCYDISVAVIAENQTSLNAVVISFRTPMDEPSVPLSLRSTRVTNSIIEIEWTQPKQPNGPIDGYVVEFAPLKGDEKSFVVTEERFIAEDLMTWSKYTFRVRAFNYALQTERLESQSAVVTVQTDVAVPGSPTNLTLVKADSSRVTFSWTSNSEYVGPSWYNVKLFKANRENGNCSLNLEVVSSQKVAETTVQYFKLQPSQCYYVSVSAETAKGTSNNAIVKAFVVPLRSSQPVPPNLHQALPQVASW